MTEKSKGLEPDKKQLADAVGETLAHVAHDFNNLLTPMVAYPDIIRMELPEQSRSLRLLETMEKTAKEMMRINRQLLALSPRTEQHGEQCDMNLIVQRVLSVIREDGSMEGVKVEVEEAANLPEISGASDRIEAAVEHVLRNAVEAMKESGCIAIATSDLKSDSPISVHGGVLDPGRYVRLTVIDSGPGIPPEMGETVFEPFVSSKRGERKRGSGLGLTMVYRVMIDHRGGVSMESSSGKGATFKLYFPCKA